jgi:biopolymer transport protein TolQ
LILSELDLIALLRTTSPVTRFVLAILLIFSVWSWGIILSKALLLRKVRRETEVFWRIFRKARNLSEISTAAVTLRFTPLVPVFNSAADVKTPQMTSTKLQRRLQRSATAQLTLLEKRMTFLATTASVAPFVGLFGTVWGVMTSFAGLANANVATLRAVAPGIADALIATAFGLFAAIPALIAYNQFTYQIRNLGGELDDLQVEMLAMTESEGI